jgi:RecA-family ATPase
MASYYEYNGKWYEDGRDEAIKTKVGDDGIMRRTDDYDGDDIIPIAALPFKSLAEFTNDNPKRWVIEGVVALEEDSSWWGPSGGLKSNLMAELGLCIAAGRDWRGHKFYHDDDPDEIERRGVIIFATERAKLTRDRLTAYATREGLQQGLPIAVADIPVNLLDPSCVVQISDTILAFEQKNNCQTALVIFDTWSKCLGGNDEMLPHVQNRAAEHVQKIRQRHCSSFHCASVGHSGKNIEAGERGSSARRAHVDFAVKIYGPGKVKTAKVEKANDGIEGITLATFEAQEYTAIRPPVTLHGRVHTLDPLTVGILAPYDPAASATDARPAASQALTVKHAQVLDALRRAIAAVGRDGAVHVDFWKEELARAGVLNLKAKNPRSAFKKLRDAVTQHLIDEPGGVVRIKTEIPIPPYASLVPTSPS